MKPVALLLTSTVALILVGACGGTSTPGPAGSASLERASARPGVILNQDLGRVDFVTFAEAMQDIVIRKYRFSLRRREEQIQSVFYETIWQIRVPTEEEQARGILDARHRVVMEGRRAGGASLPGGSQVYRISLRIDNEVRSRDQAEWHPDPTMDSEVERDLRRMVSDLQLEIRTGR
jgi:hypothetical protein